MLPKHQAVCCAGGLFFNDMGSKQIVIADNDRYQSTCLSTLQSENACKEMVYLIE